MGEFLRVLLLGGGHNTTVVMLGAAALGLACGVVGTFLMLRRRSLVSDAVAHAALPGVAGAFLIGAALGLPARSTPLLLVGAFVTAALAMAAIQWLARRPRIHEDTATAVVLATSFALGVALLSIVQSLRTGGQAGLDTYLLGSTAGMLEAEAWLTAGIAALTIAVLASVLKELAAVAFDADFAAASGLPVARLDGLVALLALAVIVIGLRFVGLILIVALLIIPAAAARFWSDRLGAVVALSGLIGAGSAYIAAAYSAVEPHTPTGAVIVLAATAIFVASLLLGTARGLVSRALGKRHRRNGGVPEGAGVSA